MNESFDAQLARLGSEGWEAFQFSDGSMYLKRQHPVMPAAQRAPSRPMPDLVKAAPQDS